MKSNYDTLMARAKNLIAEGSNIAFVKDVIRRDTACTALEKRSIMIALHLGRESANCGRCVQYKHCPERSRDYPCREFRLSETG